MTGPGLIEHLRRRIETEGSVSVAEYMALALGHPKWGYYATRDPFGSGGDFTTAPEISQMFGEILGLWVGQIWLDRSAPSSITLMELGPGRGTLMSDALRALKVVPGFLDAVSVRLVETSPVLVERQRAALSDTEARIFWHQDTVSALEADDHLLIVLANEFFDALPIRQFVKAKGGWHERQVGLNEADDLTFTISPFPVPLEHAPDAPTGALFEHGPMGETVMAELAEAIAKRGGAGVVIDYGHETSATGETLQAVKNHKFHNVLETPGEADLTTHVDFETLSRAASQRGAKPYPVQTQEDFLNALGIEARAASLSAKALPEQQYAINSGLKRLTHPDEMGTLFKVLTIANADAPPPPGV